MRAAEPGQVLVDAAAGASMLVVGSSRCGWGAAMALGSVSGYTATLARVGARGGEHGRASGDRHRSWPRASIRNGGSKAQVMAVGDIFRCGSSFGGAWQADDQVMALPGAGAGAARAAFPQHRSR